MEVQDPVLELHNLTVVYESKPAIWNVDYEIPAEQLIGIVGPNGSGKSTMLKAIMGLVKASSGYAKVFGQELEEVRQRIAYVPQRSSVDWDFPVSVFDTVLMGRYNPKNILRRTTKKDKEIALEAIRKVQLEPFMHRQISQLSGGQQQRVFIARALAQQADLYLLDEPFAGVDAATENAIMALLKQMKEEGKTIVVVHHDLQSVQEYFDWLILMNTRLIATGPTEEIFTQELLQKTYGGQLNILSRVADLIAKEEHPMRE
ncbi:MAG: metal ABC transporter ATP-binding protein [Bacteroidota bacterium]